MEDAAGSSEFSVLGSDNVLSAAVKHGRIDVVQEMLLGGTNPNAESM